jgi:hypothetical protein
VTTGSRYPSGGDDRSRRTQCAQTDDSPAGRQLLIGTKLHIPSDTGRIIARDAVWSRLDAGVAGGKITVVSAPAGWERRPCWRNGLRANPLLTAYLAVARTRRQ